MPKYKRRNLVALAYTGNVCYTTIDRISSRDDLELDLENGTWRSKPYDAYIKIGGKNACLPRREKRIIGVYDRTKIEHLRQMVRDSQDATRSRCSFPLDD